MCLNFWYLFVLIWLYQEANGQLQSNVAWNGGCSICPTGQSTGYVYRGYPVYPQYGQVYQYPHYNQNFQQLPYVYAFNQQQPVGNQQITTNTAATGNPVGTKDVYDNVKTEIIDIDPKYFRYLYSNYFPQNARKPTYTTKSVVRQQTPYVVTIESQQHNNTNVPQVIKKHDVQHKTFTFKKTFVLNPDENKNSVINLNFVNGVPVTTEEAQDMREEATVKPETVEEIQTTTEQTTTTTENENPTPVKKGGRRFIDIPESCPEDAIYLDGQCLRKFSLSSLTIGTKSNNTVPV